MRKIILNLAISLDGSIERPNSDLDWLVKDEESSKLKQAYKLLYSKTKYVFLRTKK